MVKKYSCPSPNSGPERGAAGRVQGGAWQEGRDRRPLGDRQTHTRQGVQTKGRRGLQMADTGGTDTQGETETRETAEGAQGSWTPSGRCTEVTGERRGGGPEASPGRRPRAPRRRS